MLDQAKVEGKVDIWNFAQGMRDRRMTMIQTPVNKQIDNQKIGIYCNICIKAYVEE